MINTITVDKAELQIILEAFEDFITENRNTCADECEHCGYTYGNANKDFNLLAHHTGCPVLIAKDMGAGWYETP